MLGASNVFLYFDLAGVFFEWEGGIENIAKLAGKPVDDVKKVFQAHDSDACKGLISPAELGRFYEKELSFSFKTDFLTFWVESFQPIIETHERVCRLFKEGVPIGIVTNIYKGTFEEALGKYIPDLPYRAVIKSCDYGVKKPDPKFLDIAETACGFEKSKIMLIDDNQDNVDAAIKFGWNATLFARKSSLGLY